MGGRAPLNTEVNVQKTAAQWCEVAVRVAIAVHTKLVRLGSTGWRSCGCSSDCCGCSDRHCGRLCDCYCLCDCRDNRESCDCDSGRKEATSCGQPCLLSLHPNLSDGAREAILPGGGGGYAHSNCGSDAASRRGSGSDRCRSSGLEASAHSADEGRCLRGEALELG